MQHDDEHHLGTENIPRKLASLSNKAVQHTKKLLCMHMKQVDLLESSKEAGQYA